MTNEALFSIASVIAFIGWLGLIALPRPWRFRVALGVCVPALATLYASMVFPALSGIDFMDFSSLSGVMKLQGSEEAALVGWIHYLAFDLVAGWVIANDAARLGLNRWYVVPALLLTFMLGPVGWLVYLVLRLLHGRGLLVRGFA